MRTVVLTKSECVTVYGWSVLFGSRHFKALVKPKFHLALLTSRLDTTRHVRRVEPVHFGCVELVEQHGSTRSTRQTCRIVSRRDVTSQVEFGAYRGYSEDLLCRRRRCSLLVN